ncbi:MAG: hypothetical protein AABY32_04300 [Nanoarchaeota archaeon]
MNGDEEVQVYSLGENYDDEVVIGVLLGEASDSSSPKITNFDIQDIQKRINLIKEKLGIKKEPQVFTSFEYS